MTRYSFPIFIVVGHRMVGRGTKQQIRQAGRIRVSTVNPMLIVFHFS